MATIYWDLETFSSCALSECGARNYAADPSTGIHFFCFAVDDGPVQIWRPGDPIPGPFAAPAGHTFASDNWSFERAIHEHILISRHGFPPIPLENQACAQRLALASAFPAELGLRCLALDLPYRKDPEARKAMLRLARPNPNADPAQLERYLALLRERCETDVLSTRSAYNSPRLRPLLPEDARMLLLDAKINAVGVRANTAFLTGAQAIVAQELDVINAELCKITDGAITSVGQVKRIKDAVNARGHNLAGLTKRSVAAALAHEPDDFTRELLELRRDGAHASASKAKKLLGYADPRDHRIRDVLRIFGAGPGRWAALGAALHALPRNDSELPAFLVDMVAAGDREALTRHGRPLEIVKNLSRASLCAAPGHELICPDFSAIESRITAWLAGETWKLDLFRRYDETSDDNIEPYRVLARAMLRKSVTPSELSRAERQLGKYGELAFGFGGSVGAWRRIVDDGRSDEEVQAYVQAWRAKHPATCRFWHDLAQAARTAISMPGRMVRAGSSPIVAQFDGYALALILPSGRAINYPGAHLVENARFENAPRDVEFHDNARGKWQPTRAWHGTLVENVVQGTARDLLRDALLRADARGWKIVFHCHDELVIEAPIGAVDPQDVLARMLEPPPWAAGLPLAGKVHSGPLYLEAPDHHAELAAETPDAPAPAPREAPKFPSDFDGEPGFVSMEDAVIAGASEPPPPPPPPQSEAPAKPTLRGNGQGNGFAGDGYPASDRDDAGRPVAEYVYRDLKGAPHLKVVKRRSRDGKKYFPQYHLENGQWVKGKPKGAAIPYRLPELLAAPADATVEVCEGEKDANTLAALGLIATSNPGGAGKWTPDLNKWFSGFARANVYEDNDKAGHAHAAKVARELCGVIPDVRVVRFREMPEHSDVSDWLKAGATLDQLRARCDATTPFSALESADAADVEIEDYDWVWPGRFALKKIGLIVGLPDEGKGLTFSDIAARITRGAAWPCGEGQAPLGNVAMLSAEDDISDTIVPRLIAAGADLKRVTIIKMVREGAGERMFSLVSDLGALRRKVLEIGDVKAIMIDPISAYLGIGEVDSFRATDVRAVLGPLKEFAESLRVLVLGILHFNKKTDVTNVLLRVSDSLAYSAASRHVYAVIGDPDNSRRLFVKGKNNLARYEQPTLAFTVDERVVGDDPRTGLPIRRPCIAWATELVDITATEALQAAAGNRSPSARDAARRYLEALFAEDHAPVASADVLEGARENGIAKRTLERAAADLGVTIKHDGPPRAAGGAATWRWHPPGERA
jgi:DNA polymerase